MYYGFFGHALRYALRRIVFQGQGSALARRFKFFRSLIGYEISVGWDETLSSYIVFEKAKKMYVSRKTRLAYYKNGIDRRLRNIRKEYLVDHIPIEGGDIVIDVGANIGEFSVAVADSQNLRIIAVEPDPKECTALIENLRGTLCEIYQCPLWSQAEELYFYPSNETGDSSLIRQSLESKPVQRSALPLDDILESSGHINGNEPIKLLKLEAEGAEPEVLQGVKENLHRIVYVTVDVGAERGLKKESTLVPVLNILMEAGFTPLKFRLPRPVLLFQKRGLLE